MIKNFIKKLIKAAAIIVIIAGIIFAFRYMNGNRSHTAGLKQPVQGKAAQHTQQLTQLKGSGMKKVAENNHLRLSVDFDNGNIEVVNKTDGYVWRSRPTAEEMNQEKGNKLWKQNIESPIIFDYVDNYTSANTSMGNVYNQNTKITVYKLPYGARVDFDFTKSGIKIAYDVVLKNNHLDISIPPESIHEPGAHYRKNAAGSQIIDSSKTVLLTDIRVLPFFGATRSDHGDNGYLFLPDGPGALVKFDKGKGLNSQFVGTVYGPDLSYMNKYDSTLKNALKESKILYPVYGIVRNSNSLMGIINKGESNADIIGVPAGVQTGFNSAYVRFAYRKKYKVITSPSSGNGYFKYTSAGIKLDRSIQYSFNSGSNANYVGMAKTYRDYLINSKGLKKRNPDGEEIPLQLNIYGGTMQNNFIGRSIVGMTTFKQAEGILSFFKKNHVKRLEVAYQGWGSEGAPVEQPNRFPAAGSLGGNSALTDLVQYAHQLGDKIYLDDNNEEASSRRGISLRKDTITNVLGDPLDYTIRNSHHYLLNNQEITSMLKNSIKQYKKYGIDGIEETGIGSSLETDFNKADPAGRNSMKHDYIHILNDERSNFNGIRLKNAMAYELANKTTIVNMPMDGSYSTVLDETVPFYEIALHGLVPYVFSSYNQFSAPDEQMLRAIEYGGNVSFNVTSKPTQRLRNIKDNRLYSTQFSLWKNTILRQYKRLSSGLDAVQGQYITDYKKLSADVSVVTYEKGTKVVCNASGHPFIYEGRTVKPMDFILIKGQ